MASHHQFSRSHLKIVSPTAASNDSSSGSSQYGAEEARHHTPSPWDELIDPPLDYERTPEDWHALVRRYRQKPEVRRRDRIATAVFWFCIIVATFAVWFFAWQLAGRPGL
jgi:hypothetical protein